MLFLQELAFSVPSRCQSGKNGAGGGGEGGGEEFWLFQYHLSDRYYFHLPANFTKNERLM